MKRHENKTNRFFRTITKALVSLTVFALISCNNLFSDRTEKNVNGQKARLIVTASATTVSRQAIDPILSLSDFSDFKLYATTTDLPENLETLTAIATGDSLEELNEPAIELESGTWHFALTASLDGVTFSGTNTKFEVSPASTNPISFTLTPEITGGGLEIKMTFPTEADKVHIKLARATGGTVVFEEDLTASSTKYPIVTASGKNTITFTRDISNTSERLTPGAYTLEYTFYDSEITEYLNTCEFIVNIAAGVTTSEKNLNISNLNEVYTISYEFKYYTYDGSTTVENSITEDELLAQNAGVVLPKKYFRKSNIELPVLNSYNGSADNVMSFEGWFDEADNLIESWDDIDPDSEDITLCAKWLAYNSEGNININTGLLNITATLPEKSYVNEGEITFGATLKSDDTDVSTDADIVWNAKLLYGGMDVNDYGSYYTFTAPTETTPAKMEITNCLDTAGTYQILVSAQYAGLTSCQTFTYEANAYKLVLENYNLTDSTSQANLENQINLAAKAGTPVELTITGVGSDGTDGTDGSLAYLIGKLSAIPAPIDLNISGITNITKVATGIFGASPELTNLALPQDVTEIGAQAFLNCSSIETITIPDSVTDIGFLAFPIMGSKLKKFILSGNSANPGYSALADGALLVKNETSELQFSAGNADLQTLDFSSDELVSIASVANYAFYNNSNLESITSFGSIKMINTMSFAACNNLTSVNLAGVTEICESAFSRNKKLTTVSNMGAVSIHNQAFAYSGLTSIVIPEGVEFIDDKYDEDEPESSEGCQVFYNDSDLRTVTIAPGFSGTLDGTSFERCDSLEQFIIADGSYGSNQKTKYYARAVGDVQGALLVKDFTDNEDITTISLVCASRVSNVTAIDFSESSLNDITKIEKKAFALDPNDEVHEKSKLQTITSFGNVITIEKNAFEYSTLTTISDFGSVLNIRGYAFSNTKLRSIPAFKDGMTLGDYPFNSTDISVYQFDSYNINADNSCLRTNASSSQIIINYEIDYNTPASITFISPNGGGPVLSGVNNVTEVIISQKANLPDLTYNSEDESVSISYSTNKIRVFSIVSNTIESISFTGSDSVIGDYQFCCLPADYEPFANLQTVDLSGVIAIGTHAFYRPDQNDITITLNSTDTNWYVTTDKSVWEGWINNYNSNTSFTIEDSLKVTVPDGSTLTETIKGIIAPSEAPNDSNKQYLFLKK